MLIRKAEENDIEKIKKMYDELREFELSLLDKETRKMQENWEVKKSQEDIKKIIKKKNILMLVAEIDKKIAGFIIGEISKGVIESEGRFDIYVKKEFRKKGAGKKLIKSMISWFKKKRCKFVSLNVYSMNIGAKKFYKKLGFKIIGENYKMKI